MTDTIFFRLLDRVNRPSRLSGAIEELREGGETADTYSAEPASLRQVPSSPFAYWVSENIRSKFTELLSFEGRGRTVKQGLATADDFRFVRTWWEVGMRNTARSREETLEGKRWVPFAKGGEYSPYHAAIHLMVNWEQDGRELRSFDRAVVRNPDFYFHPGLTWPRRTQRGLSVRVHPEGCIFADKGPVIFSSSGSLASLLAIANSRAFHALVELQMAFGSYEVGVIQRTPISNLPEAEAALLGDLALRCVYLKQSIDSANEVSHAFHLPALLQIEAVTLRERLTSWLDQVSTSERQLAEHQRKIDNIAFRLYGIEDEDRRAIEESLSDGDGAAVSVGS